MTRYRIAILFSVSALIPLSIAYFLPIVKLENVEDGRITLLWIWGLSVYSSDNHFGLSFPFIIISICMLVAVVFLFKSWFTLRKDVSTLDAVSRDWINIGLYIIGLEIGWIFWLFFLKLSYFLFAGYIFEFPIILPLICGIMLLIAGKLSMRLHLREAKSTLPTDVQR